MGWDVHVIPVVVYVAVCTDEWCPGPRTDGQWTGPDRASSDFAEGDAAKHYKAHDDLYRRYNQALERGDGRAADAYYRGEPLICTKCDHTIKDYDATECPNCGSEELGWPRVV